MSEAETGPSLPEWVDRLAAAFVVTLPPLARKQLVSYVELVQQWNRKVNLTGARAPGSLCEVLLADAFVLLDEKLVDRNAKVLDVGSGAGAPIVPLLILRPDVTALCLEPRQKRAAFLRLCSARLSLLDRMRVSEDRLDPHQPEPFAGKFDVACSRATFAPEQWVVLGLAVAPVVLVLSADAPPQAPSGSRLRESREYSLPFSTAPRTLGRYCSERGLRG
jgi:16S rRNA (guanine527-N7)-methyltransferase